VSVRIGYGLGTAAGAPPDGAMLRGLAEALERHGFDSLWLSERIGNDTIDPVVGLTYAAAVTSRLKLGFSVLVLPGRNPALLAKQLASVDRLSGGRLLPAFGLGAPHANEHQAFAVEPAARAPGLEEALPLLRRFWREDRVDHDGPRFHFRDVTVRPKPAGRMDVWLGGAGEKQLARVGRLADGWLGSFATPEEAGEARRSIERAADQHGREVDPGHFGVLIPYTRSPLTGEHTEALLARGRRGRPAVPVADLVAQGSAAVVPLLERFVANGVTKFVLLPLHPVDGWDGELGALAETVAPLQGAAV
jgi:probable F420-dependent oxidoreductase